MGKLTNFQIAVKDGKDVFHSGEFVEGNVLIDLQEEMELNAVRVKLKGSAFLMWTEHYGQHVHVTYYNKEKYFSYKTALFGADKQSNTTATLRAGSHVFPFSFQLPPDLPTSFEGCIGHIRYRILATIERPWSFDQHTKSAFTVIDHVDLNLDPAHKLGVARSGSKEICCWCCVSPPVKSEVSVGRSGFVPGEIVPINAKVHNPSSYVIDGTTAKLVQKVKWKATNKTRNTFRTVAKIKRLGCKARGWTEWVNEGLAVPSVPPTLTVNCKIIDITYRIEFIVKMPTCRSLKIKCPVTIGTIPISDVTPFNALPPPVADEEGVPPPPVYEPPVASYATTVGKPVSIKEAKESNSGLFGDSMFSPKYAYYDWNKRPFQYK